MKSERSLLKKILPIAKIAFAVGLITFVLWRQQIRDRLEIPEAGVQKSYDGSLSGRGEQLTFTSSELEATIELEPAAQPGKKIVAEVTARDRRTGHAVTMRRADLKPGQDLIVEHGLISTLKGVDVPLILLSLLLYLFACAFSVYRWHLLLISVGLNVSFWQAFRLTFIGLFCNNFVPGLTGGDLIKAIYIARACHTQKAGAVVTVLVDRGLGITGLALVAGAVIPFNMDKFGVIAWPIYGFLIAVFGGSCLFFSKRVRRAMRLDALLQRLPFAETLKKIDSAIYVYKSRLGTLFVSLATSVVVHIVILSCAAVIGKALGIDIPFTWYFGLVPLALIVQSLPVSPQGWGVGELAFVTLFGLVGVPNEQALALSLGFRVVMMAASLLGGVFMATEKQRMPTMDRESEESDAVPV